MSFRPIKAIQLLMRDVLRIPEAKIKQGRANSVYNFKDDFYLVDVDSVQPLAQGKHYDDETDESRYTLHFKALATITFMGPSCEEMANKLITVLNSAERSYYTQRDLKITLLRMRSYEYIKKQFSGEWWPVIVITAFCQYSYEHRTRANYIEKIPTKYLNNE